jgi:hypothetical protein
MDYDLEIIDEIAGLDFAALDRLIEVLTKNHRETMERQAEILSRLQQIREVKIASRTESEESRAVLK